MKILVYIEPHPIRNYHEEFADVGAFLIKALLSSCRVADFEFRYFSNNTVVDRLTLAIPAAASSAMRPTVTETREMAQFDETWNQASIQRWLSLVLGKEQVSDTYRQILRRIHSEFKFDVVLMWSENGAVASVARDLGASVVHGELGPTRPPFPSTVYFDAKGTNGNASVLQVPSVTVLRTSIVPPETWAAMAARAAHGDDKLGVVDAGLTYQAMREASPPHGRYVYIPMQLADDLNTLLHSPFTTPLSFLQAVVPHYLKLGYQVVIKGHPAAMGRPYNLSKESQALSFAKSLSDNVRVVPRGLSAAESQLLMTQASKVCTINSSVGFEALLLGKPVIVHGDAVYGAPRRTVDTRMDGLELADERERVSFLMSHYFLPKDAVEKGDAVFRAISLIRRHASPIGDVGEAFWDEWAEQMSFGQQAAATGDWSSRKVNELTSMRRSPLAGARRFDECSNRQVSKAGDSIYVDAVLDGNPAGFQGDCETSRFIGFVDGVERTTGGKWKIRGWALEQRNLRPPVTILVAAAGTVVSCHRVVAPRKDVVDNFGGDVALRCGYEFEVSAEAFSKTNDRRLYFVSSGNIVQEVPLREGDING